MKRNKRLTTKFWLLLFCMMPPFLGSAQQFKVNDIWYSIMSSNTAAVIYDPYNRNSYLFIDPIIIPSTVTYNKKEYSVVRIEEGAFMDRGKLSSITIPKSITSIGRGAFAGCSPDSVHISSIESWYNIDFSYSTSNPLCSGRNLYLNGELVTDLVVPDTIAEIKSYIFEGCVSLKSIVLPESITNIGNYAFKDCSNLTTINIPEGIPHIGNYTFYGCSSLAAISLPNTIKGIGWNAFQTCSSLTSINIPDSVTWIGEKAFLNCKSLSTITLPKGIKSLGEETFRNCSNLTTINLPENITKIGVKAFEKCEKLTSITIPEKMTTIESYAFQNCISLSEVKIPEGVVTIGYNAFYGCSNLTTIVLESSKFEGLRSLVFANCSKLRDVYCNLKTVLPSASDAFKGSNVENATLHVPAKTLEAYKTTAPWSSFGRFETLEITVTDITLSQTTATLIEGEDLALTVTIAPEDADDKSITWSSSDETIATVDADGKVTAVAPGTATITATANDGSGVSASCEITVSPASYAFTLLIDEEVFYTDTLTRGSRIESVIEPVKEGYTFSGWGEIPEVMPAHDVTLNATFIINKYLVTYKIDGVKIATDSIEYNATIVAPNVPEKEGYTFNGWGEIAETMPAHDLVYESSYSVNSYTLTFIVDEEVYAQETVEYGTTINAPEAPAKEGYEFVEWSGLQKTMPAKDITVTATYKSLKPVYLAIRQADNGCVKLKLFEGASCTFIIEAIEGWAINAVTFNGEDITSQLEDGNTFTTPEMLEDAVLNISYEKIDDSIEQAEARKIAVRGHNGIISISGAEQGETITIYTLDGTMVANKTAATEITSVEVPTGKIYLVKVADKVVKIGM